DVMMAGARKLGGSDGLLAYAPQLVSNPVEGFLNLAGTATDVDGEIARVEALHGEAGDAVRQAALVAQLHEVAPALAGEHRREHFQRPARPIRQARSVESEHQARYRLVELLHSIPRR